MSALEKMREAFETCTVMAGVEPDFECIYITKDAANALFDEAEAENAKMRELAVLNWEWAHSCCGNSCKMQTEGCGYGIDRECIYEREIWERMRELGIEVNDGK